MRTSPHDTPPLAPGALPGLGHLLAYRRDPLGFLMLAAAHGPVVTMKLGPLTAILLREPEDIERVLVGEHKRFIKDEMTRGISRVLGDGLLTSEGESWLRHRRLLAPAFHRERVSTYGDAMVEATDRFVHQLPLGTNLDLHAEMLRLTLEIVVRALFDSEVTGVARDVSHAVEVLVDRYGSGLYTLLPFLEKLPTEANRSFEKALSTLDEVLLGIIRGRREKPTGGSDLLSTLLAAQDEEGKGLSDREMRDELMTLFIAGHETTALALTYALMLVFQSPDTVKRLQNELDNVLGDRLPKSSDVANLPFVRAVLLEAMRLYPPAWAIGRETREEFSVGGYVLPKGAQVWLAQWVNHRDPRYFPSPERFWPERWLDGLAKSLPKFAYYPFGGGPRICIGQAFSMMEAELVLTTILRRLVLVRLDDAPPALSPVITLRPTNPIVVRFSERA